MLIVDEHCTRQVFCISSAHVETETRPYRAQFHGSAYLKLGICACVRAYSTLLGIFGLHS